MLDQVVFDTRYFGSRAFGEAAARAGRVAVGFPGDVTALWQRSLLPAWAAGACAVAGMTTPSALFCLEQLAKDHWMRVVLRVEHRRRLCGSLEHGVTAAEPMVTRLCAALSATPDAIDRVVAADWPARWFGALSGYQRSKNQPLVTHVVAGADHGRFSSVVPDLVSWVIAA